MRSDVKNIFCTFTFGDGIGGHYFSMEAILAASFFEDTNIIELGYNQSPILRKLKQYHFIKYSLLLHIQAINNLKKNLSSHKSVNIFCFDIFSYILLNSACRTLNNNIKLTLVKCGGPNPTLYYPPIENLVCFSEENYNYFINKENSNKKCISLIPNRVVKKSITSNQKFDNDISNMQGLKILCIARIGTEYKKKIELAYALKEKLTNVNCTLVIIGSIVQFEVFEDLKSILKEDVTWLTSSRYTENAVQYINLFDIVIGTGRGAVESLLLNKNTYIPINNSNSLTLVDEENLAELAKGNFSGRTIMSNFDIADEIALTKIPSKTLLLMVEDMFSIENSNVKYHGHISNCKQYASFGKISRIKNTIYFVYSVFREKNTFFSRLIYPTLKTINSYIKTK